MLFFDLKPLSVIDGKNSGGNNCIECIGLQSAEETYSDSIEDGPVFMAMKQTSNSSELAHIFSRNGYQIVRLAISGLDAKRSKFEWEKYLVQNCQGIEYWGLTETTSKKY
jgi:hypothetical protein